MYEKATTNSPFLAEVSISFKEKVIKFSLYFIYWGAQNNHYWGVSKLGWPYGCSYVALSLNAW
jgi:hypothetical protein